MKREALALLFALFDTRASLVARLAILASLLYLVSPFDLVPEVVPLAGLVDDLLLVPLGLSFAHSRIPEHLLAAARVRSAPYNRWFTVALVVLAAAVFTIVAFALSAIVRLVG